MLRQRAFASGSASISALAPFQKICTPMHSRMNEIGRCTPLNACSGILRAQRHHDDDGAGTDGQWKSQLVENLVNCRISVAFDDGASGAASGAFSPANPSRPA